MLFDFNFKSTTLLLFFFHGVIFSFLLLKKGFEENNPSSYWLSFFIFLCCLYIAPFMLGYANWYSVKLYRELLFFAPLQQVLLIGPVLFFYTKSLLDKSFRFSFKQFFHFLPALLYLAYCLIIFVADKLIFDEYYFYADQRDKDLSLWYQVVGLFSMIIYLVMSLHHYRVYKNMAYATVSFVDSILFKWIEKYLIIFLLILILRIVLFILNPDWGQFGSKYWYYLSFSVLFYYIALMGYINSCSLKTSNQNLFNAEKIKLEKNNKHQTLNKDELNELKAQLNDLMRFHKLFENPNLTLSDISKKLKINIKTVSHLINQGFDLNFNDFINKQRIDAIITKLQDSQYRKKTLLTIAFENGFNSKATFNRAFKKQTSMSPSAFINKNILK